MPKKETKKIRGIFERPKRSGVWWIRYADEFGQIHREKVGMRSRAIDIYQQRKTEIRQGKFEPEDVKRKNQQALVSEIIEDRLKQVANLKDFRNFAQRLNWWKERLGNRAVKSIVAQDIEQARKALMDQGAQPSTCNRYLACFKTVFSYAILNGKAQRNPVKQVKLAREDNSRVRWLTHEEEARLFTVLPNQYHSMVLVALHTGLRKTEQFSLEWQDIDFQQGQIRVRKSKSGKSRIIPMSQTISESLRSLSKVRLINNPYVFPGEKPGTYRTDLPKYWEGYLRQAGIENFHWHDLRHTFASRLVMAGVDLYTVKELLGHSDFKMTMRYAHLSPGHLKNAVAVLDNQTSTKTSTSFSQRFLNGS